MARPDHDHEHAPALGSNTGGAHGHRHHHHGHGHGPSGNRFGRAFAVGIALNLAFVLAEAGYGLAANSLALIADAGHNLSDVLGLGLAWGAASLCQRRPTQRYTYGLRSTTILAALANAVMLLVVTGGIAWESIQRLIQPEPVAGTTMIVVALIGIVVNGVTAAMFASGRRHDLNIRSAFWHMAADAMTSLGVAGAGVLILWTGSERLDAIVGLAISGVIVVGTWSVLRDSVDLALDAVPRGIDAGAVRLYLAGLPGVSEVHDLHIWGMSTTEVALTAHLVRPEATVDDGLLAEVAHELKHRFGIGHATLQIELGHPGYVCALAPEHVV
ncbi:MAG: cation transporter [Proteobacteria bacterium]|nr:cation transporter [Pseudomonadota bacterium]MBI3499800.1 cation transporter [Pseudomonadota bacterium]